MNEDDMIDPYAFLDLSCDAKEEEIQEAFRVKLATIPDKSKQKETLICAYGMIRHLADRNRFRWDEVRSFLVNPFHDEEKKTINKKALAKELAFLNNWEAGDDSCLS